MANTRSQIRDLCRRRLGDLAVPYEWSDLQVNQWINDAIGDYNLHFPLAASLELETQAGQNAYDLESPGLRRVSSVEYPTSEGGPALENQLARRDHTRPGFLAQVGFYDVEYSPSAASEIRLWLSGPVAAGTARLKGTADHAYLDDDSDESSLPERHLELVMLYVRWAAFQELAMDASADPDPTSLALGTLELNAYRAQRLYLTALAECLKAESESRVIQWKFDQWDRVY